MLLLLLLLLIYCCLFVVVVVSHHLCKLRIVLYHGISRQFLFRKRTGSFAERELLRVLS